MEQLRGRGCRGAVWCVLALSLCHVKAEGNVVVTRCSPMPGGAQGGCCRGASGRGSLRPWEEPSGTFQNAAAPGRAVPGAARLGQGPGSPPCPGQPGAAALVRCWGGSCGGPVHPRGRAGGVPCVCSTREGRGRVKALACCWASCVDLLFARPTSAREVCRAVRFLGREGLCFQTENRTRGRVAFGVRADLFPQAASHGLPLPAPLEARVSSVQLPSPHTAGTTAGRCLARLVCCFYDRYC